MQKKRNAQEAFVDGAASKREYLHVRMLVQEY